MTNKLGKEQNQKHHPHNTGHLFLQMTVCFPLLHLLEARQIQVLTILPTEKLREREDRKGIKGEKKERTKYETSRKRKKEKKKKEHDITFPRSHEIPV